MESPRNSLLGKDHRFTEFMQIVHAHEAIGRTQQNVVLTIRGPFFGS